jgi:hypothetical protein
MATTTYLEWDDQATGANNNTWGDVLDANQTIFELAIARFLSIATTGGTTTLTSSQNRYPIIRLTGTLVSNATIEVRTAEKNWLFINNTTGNFTVTVKTASGTGKTLPRGRSVKLYCDGANVEHARAPGIPVAQAGGTADAITATFEPATTSSELQDGTLFIVEAATANTTTTPTFSPDSLTARTITKSGGQALAVGDIRGAGHKLLLMYDSSSTRYELLNPAVVAASLTVSGIVELATTTETLTGTDATRAVTPDGLAALWEAGSNITDGATITIGEGGYFNLLTSTVAITAFSITTDKSGRTFRVRFDTVRTLTHNATSLILPGGANITTAQGDIAQFRSLGSGNVVCEWYTRANGQALAGSGAWRHIATLSPSAAASIEQTGLSAYKMLRITGNNIIPATDNVEFYIRISSDGVTYLSANYDTTCRDANSANSTVSFTIGNPASGGADIGNAAGDGGLGFQVIIDDFSAAQKTKCFGQFVFGDTGGAIISGTVRGWQTAQTAMQALQFLFSSGNIASGEIIIEGVT